MQTDAKEMQMTDTVTEAPEAPSTELEAVLARRIRSGQVNLAKLLRALETPPAAPVPTEIPDPAPPITAAQRQALARLEAVYGTVAPRERRALTTEEIAALLDERAVIDEVVGLANKRKEGMKRTVFNHMDVEAEESGQVPPGTERASNGHYAVNRKVGAPGRSQVFSREVRQDAPQLIEERLRQMADDPNCDLLTHQDWLDMTEATRVVSEPKAMLAIQRNPKLLRALQEAMAPHKTVLSLNMRKA